VRKEIGNNIDISVIINAHRDGLLLLPSLKSAANAIADAEDWGLRCQMLVTLDCPDALTAEIANHALSLTDSAQCMTVDVDDLGRSRNAAVQAASGAYVAFLDGDDLWSRTWLSDALAFSCSDSRLLVLHPEFNIFFGHNPQVFTHVDMEDSSFDIAALALDNVWTSLCFAPRRLLLDCPYPQTDLANHIGYEDWGWNMRAIEWGALHKIVPGSSHAIRRKAVSLVRQTVAAGCFPAYPPRLFKPNRASL
jgi:glycosyltransferase involved in cell wall biosynthesis